MLIAFLALIALANGVLGGIHNRSEWRGFPPACSRSSAHCLRPSRGSSEFHGVTVPLIGNLLGTRMVLNELVAFSMLGPQKSRARSALVYHRDLRALRLREFKLDRNSAGRDRSARSQQERGELARLGIRAMLAGTMANLMSASIAGMLL